MCARTEPAGTGIGAVCVERSRQTSPKKRLDHTRCHSDKHTYRETIDEARYFRTTRFEEDFFLWTTKNTLCSQQQQLSASVVFV